MEDKNINRELLDELRLRAEKIQKCMYRDGIEAVLISSNTNIYYAAGRMFRGYVYVPGEGEAVCLVIRPGRVDAPGVEYIRKPEQIPEVLATRGIVIPRIIGLEEDSVTCTEMKRLRKVFSAQEVKNASGIIREARIVKTPYELAKMREDGSLQAETYAHFGRLYRDDMTDIEFQIEMERLLRLKGCLGFSRKAGNLMELNMGSVVAGTNADVPGPYDFTMGGSGVDLSLPVGADGSVIREGTSVMVDMNGNFNGYQTDLTRVWKLGTIPEEAMAAHDLSRRILRRLEKISVPGFPVSEMAREAYEMVEKEGFSDYFMGHRQKAGFIGHGVGIELNEQPVIMTRNSALLKENMTIALEPKFVIPKVGAVGVENTYIVTANGLENITVCPEEIRDLR